MTDRARSKYYFPFLIIASVILSMIFYFGIVLEEDLTGRMIIGSVWLLVSIGWTSKYIRSKKTKTS